MLSSIQTPGGGQRTPPHSLEHLWLSAHRAYSLSQQSAAIILQASNALNKRFKKANPHSSVLPSSTLQAARRISDEKGWTGLGWSCQLKCPISSRPRPTVRVVIKAGQREWNGDGSKILRLVEHYCLNLNKWASFSC